MSDGPGLVFDPVRAPPNRPPEPDPRSEYRKLSEDARDNPSPPHRFSGLLSTILMPFAEDKGELVIVQNNNRAYFEQDGRPFTNFGVVLLAVIIVHFLDQIRYELELLIWGENLPRKVIRLEMSDLDSIRWLNDLGPQYICERRKIQDLKVLIQAMAQYAPVKDEYMYPGWVIGREDTFIMKGRQLCGADWDTDRAKASCAYTLNMLEVAPHSLTVPLLAIALLSLVQSRMMALGDYFKGVCCIVAPTQSFKTTLASLFFDFENGRQADTNFEATVAAIVRTVGSIRDSTVIVDDLKPGATKAEANEMVRKLSTVVRMVGDNSGGVQKAGTDNSTLSNVAQGLVTVTAEQIQLQVQSTLARLLILEMNRQSVDVQKLSYFQEHHQQYLDFIQDYICSIASQGVNQYCENLVQQFRRERYTLRKELGEDIPVDNRTSDMCTWLWIAFLAFLNYALKLETITQEECENYTHETRTLFLTLMEQQAERVADLAPIKQFFRGLQVLLETKEVRIGELQARNSGFAVADSKEAIGFSKKSFIYLKNGVAFQAVASYYRRFGKDFTVNESSLRKALADSGCIIPKDKKSYIHRLFVNHESYQCIQFEDTKFHELLRGGKNNETEYDSELPSDRALRKNANAFLGR